MTELKAVPLHHSKEMKILNISFPRLGIERTTCLAYNTLVLHRLASDGTQSYVLTSHQSKEMKILNISFPRVGIEPTTCRAHVTLMPKRHEWPQIINNLIIIYILIVVVY